jgi:hypothetical protein
MEEAEQGARSVPSRPVGPLGRLRDFNGRRLTPKPSQMHYLGKVEVTISELRQGCQVKNGRAAIFQAQEKRQYQGVYHRQTPHIVSGVLKYHPLAYYSQIIQSMPGRSCRAPRAKIWR